jgi:hypothetical protein
MAREVCQQIIANLTGREVSEAEVLRLEKRVQARIRRMQANDATLTENNAIRESINEIVAEDTAAVTAKRRAALLNEGKRLQAQGKITSGAWGKQYGLGLRSLVTGTQRNVKGARISAGGQQLAAEVTLSGGLQGGISALGRDVWKLFTSDALETDIARALYALRRDVPDQITLAKLHPTAVKIAEVIGRMQELARVMANKEGAAIGKIDGYITRQAHDVARIARDREGWMAMARQTFDLPRMQADMGFDSVDAMLESLYEPLSTGLHLKVSADKPNATVKRGLGSLANKLSKERVIHFKGADEFMAYNRDFGAGNLRESVAHGLSQSAKSIGLLQVMGTNPAAFLDAMASNLERELKKTKPDAAAVKRFTADIAKARSRLKTIDGSNSIAGSEILANASMIYRSLKTISSLGGSMISSFNDVASFIVSARHNGINGFQAFDAAMRGIFSARQPHERAELASTLGVMFDSLNGHVANRFNPDEGLTGKASFVMQKYFQANLQNWWTDGLRFAAAQMLSHNLGLHAGKTLSELEPALAKTLNLYGVDEAGWNEARKAVRNRGGNAYLAPELIKDENVKRAMQAYFSDQNGYLVLTPDAETRHLVTLGTQRGTVAGEAARLLMQFKAFTVSFNQRMIGRELVGNVGIDTRGAGDVLAAAAKSGSAWGGMSQLMVMTTLFGYASMYAKDTLKGKTPRDPTDPHTAIAAALQGGGLGIMGDFLFANASRTGSDPLINALGPAAGDADATIKLLLAMREVPLETDPEKRQAKVEKIGDDLFKLSRSNIPGNNLFYVKPVMDYLFMWHLQEAMNPGAMARMEKQAAATGQTYFVSPSQRVAEQRRSQQ